MHPKKHTYILSLLINILAAVTSAGGLFSKGLYRDSEFIKTAWFGNDLVTLCLVVPALFILMVLSKKGSLRAFLLWLGLLGYYVYNYAFYLFGALINEFFLLYVAIFSLSIYALVLGIYDLNIAELKNRFSERTPVRWISIFLLFISLPLAIAETGMVVNFMITGKPPEAPSLIFALDLSVVVPNSALAAFLLWKKKSWGYLLSSIMLVKAFTYGLVLSISTTLIGKTGIWDPLFPFYLFVATGGLVFTFVLLKNLKSDFR